MKYKLILADYDGTTAIGGIISQKVKDAISRYRQNGGTFAFCTGRHEASIKQIMERNGVSADALISMQGGLIEVGDKVVCEGGYNAQQVIDILNDAQSFGLTGAIWQGKNLFYDDGFHSETYAKRFLDDLLDKINGFHINDKNDLLKYDNAIFTKVCFGQVKGDVFYDFTNFINEKYKGILVANSGGSELIEVVSANYTKYQGAKRLAEYLGFSEDEVITIGDSTNDLPLLEYGFSIAVENATPELKQIAKYIAPSVTDDAVEFIINKALNNEEFI